MGEKSFKTKLIEGAEKAVNTLGGWILKSFRGLVCEHKAGGWELSKGAVMAWILFYQIYQMAGSEKIPVEWVIYTFAGLMGYNAWKLIDLKGALGKK